MTTRAVRRGPSIRPRPAALRHPVLVLLLSVLVLSVLLLSVPVTTGAAAVAAPPAQAHERPSTAVVVGTRGLGVPGGRTDVCDQAAALTQAGLPQRALALLDRLLVGEPGSSPSPARVADPTQPPCADQRSEALARVGEAQLLVAQVPVAREVDAAHAALVAARGASPAGDDDAGGAAPAAPSAAEVAQEQLDDALARLQGFATAGSACAAPATVEPGRAEETVLAAARVCDRETLVDAAADAADRSEGALAGERWAAFEKEWLTPLTAVAVAALVLLLVTLMLARLLTRVVPVDAASPPEPRRRAWERWGYAGVAAFAVTFSVGVAGGWPAGLFVLAALFGLLGVGVLAWAYSRALNVHITVQDDSGKEQSAAAGQVVALLNELGASAPRGVEAPRGTDVTALQDAGIDSSPAGTLASAAYRLVRLLSPRSPWQVRIDVVSPDLHAVRVTRNGRTETAVTVDRAALGVTTADLYGAGGDDHPSPRVQPDLYRLSAAVVLCAMHERHHFPGMAGARDWRSIGLHYIASTQLLADEPTAVRLLALAVQREPTNQLAELALWVTRFRTSTSRAELALYIEFLEAKHDALFPDDAPEPPSPTALPEDAALRLRVLMALAVARINLAFLDPTPPSRPLPDDRGVVSRGLDLATRAAAPENADAGVATLGTRVLPAFRALAAVVAADAEPRPPREIGWSPHVDYLWACFHATAPARETAEERTERFRNAVRHLRASDADPDYAVWKTKDPQLATLRSSPVWTEAFGRPAGATLFSVDPFKPFAKALRAHRLTTVEQLAAATADPLDHPLLAARLGTDPWVVAELHRAAVLVGAVDPALHRWRFEIGSALYEHGLTPIPHASPPAVVDALVDALRTLEDPPDREALVAWLGPPAAASGSGRRGVMNR